MVGSKNGDNLVLARLLGIGSGLGLLKALVGNRSRANQGIATVVNEKVTLGRNTGKNLVKVENDGRLRLRWTYQGKRFTLAIGLPDSATNRIVAEGKASIIEGDIATGNFDSTLNKYKPQSNYRSFLETSLLNLLVSNLPGTLYLT